MTKNIKFLLIVIVCFITSTFLISSADAKTLRDLKNELSEKEQEYAVSKNQKKLTESEISSKKASISKINDEISYIQDEMVDLTLEIEKLTEEIELKEQEIKDIMNYYELSNGDSAYLEYIFNAADYTDFIYRMAIAEQLSSYNDKLIKEYNAKIEENENKNKELSDKTVSLSAKQKVLEQELLSLKGQLNEIVEEYVSIEDEIDSLKEYIYTYETTYKCGLDEDINTCGRDKLPPGTSFFRPVVSGRVTANFGWYDPFGKTTWHYGIDFGGTGHGAEVYPIANGKVVAITRKSSCGGNMLFIQHNVKGTTYTSGYFHLARINVNIGDTVTYNTVVGYVGGNPGIETWDKCSTGTHLHLQLAYGLYMDDYSKFSVFQSKSFNPRIAINIPAQGVWFTSRTVKY